MKRDQDKQRRYVREHQARKRAAMKLIGATERKLYAHPGDWPEIKALSERLLAERMKEDE
jgi:hypothetical protein